MYYKDKMNDSDEVLEEELEEYCESELLSEDGLREIFERHELIPSADNNLRVEYDYQFFIQACFNERVTEAIIRLLIEYFPDAARPSAYENWCPAETPLHAACENPNVTLNIIQLLIDEAPETISDLDHNDHQMPLHYLCNNDELDESTATQIMKLLISKHPEAIRHADNKGDLPIHIAAMSKSPEFCRVLMDAYPESERIANDFGSLPLHFACKCGSAATVEYLYKLYPDAIYHATTSGNFPVHYAISSIDRSDNPTGAVDIVKFLLDCDPDVKEHLFEGKPLLHVACKLGCTDSNMEAALGIIQLIYDEYPESICIEDSGGQLPLHHCCGENQYLYERGAFQILRLLLEKHPKGVRHADRHGRLPIHHAALTKSAQYCRVLIEAFPGSEQISSLSGDLPLHYACWYNTAATMQYFYKLYPDAVNQRGFRGYYPIHYAIKGVTDNRYNPTSRAEGVEIVQFLLDCDRNVKLQKLQGKSLLHIACRANLHDSNIDAALEVIKTIYDINPEAIEEDGIASQVQHFCEEAQAFINSELVYARQAKDHRLMMTPDENGQLPLHTALQNNVRLGSIKLLVKGNPSAIRSVDDCGAFPLHVACEYHDTARVVEYMLGLADNTLSAIDGQGNTTLHLACRGARHETISLLLDEFGAVSVSKRNVDGKLPIDLLWESIADRESVAYTESVYRLFRAYPEMMMGVDVKVQSAPASCSSLTGKKRKLGE